MIGNHTIETVETTEPWILKKKSKSSRKKAVAVYYEDMVESGGTRVLEWNTGYSINACEVDDMNWLRNLDEILFFHNPQNYL